MWYNKLDTKLRANVKGGQLKMKRAVYDKQFKMAAVKHAQSMDQSVSEVAKHSASAGVLCADGLMNTTNMEKGAVAECKFCGSSSFVSRYLRECCCLGNFHVFGYNKASPATKTELSVEKFSV